VAYVMMELPVVFFSVCLFSVLVTYLVLLFVLLPFSVLFFGPETWSWRCIGNPAGRKGPVRTFGR
jgi:hypothetical protein